MKLYFKENFVKKMEEIECHLNIEIINGKKKFISLKDDTEIQQAIYVADEITEMGFVKNCILHFLSTHYNLYGVKELQFVYDEFSEAQLLWDLQAQVELMLASGKYFVSTKNESIARAQFEKYIEFALKEMYANIIINRAKEKYELSTRQLKNYVWWRKALPGDVEIRDYSNAELIGMLDPKYFETPRFMKSTSAKTIKSMETELNGIRRGFGMQQDSIDLVSTDRVETALSLEMFDDNFMPGIDKAVIFDRFNGMKSENKEIMTMFADGYTYVAIGKRFSMTNVGAKKRLQRIITFLKTGEDKNL